MFTTASGALIGPPVPLPKETWDSKWYLRWHEGHSALALLVHLPCRWCNQTLGGTRTTPHPSGTLRL